ncbi:UNVERIFIED_CONTAM: hypothetical protein Sradi_6881100 [Sesamum radiatum]|uniref:Uncharacterized protein n=1 Tax=Sesamum radiatum TaxID=300843 RepID=A0AAW2JJB3_SESRA
MAMDPTTDILISLERVARLVLLKATKLEQSMLQQRAKIQWLKGGDQCSKFFFPKIAGRRAAQKVFHITSDDGSRITDEPGVANEFVRFYTSLLGGQRRRQHIDLIPLQAHARHIISVEEGESMIRPVSPGEVKEAVFDIAEDKAPDWMGILSDSSKLPGV